MVNIVHVNFRCIGVVALGEDVIRSRIGKLGGYQAAELVVFGTHFVRTPDFFLSIFFLRDDLDLRGASMVYLLFEC